MRHTATAQHTQGGDGGSGGWLLLHGFLLAVFTCSDSVRNILRPNFKFRVQQEDGEQLYEVHMNILCVHMKGTW